jgi:SAM-dependent methyltransferase
MSGADTKRVAPAAERNLAPILDCLGRHAPASGHALELASGTGQHIVHFAAAHPGLTWQPSDLDLANLPSIAAWAQASAAPNLSPPIVLDAAQPGWSAVHSDLSLILMVNVLHLVSTVAAQTILHECSAAMRPGGRLLIYGPFLRAGKTTSAGDAQFDDDLRARDPAIGYKDHAWVQAELAATGIATQIEQMPANNLMVIGTKS